MLFTILLLSLVLPSLTDAAGDARFAPKQDSEGSENLVQKLESRLRDMETWMQDEKNEKEKLEVRMQEMEMEMRHEKEKQSRETGELNARNKEMETRLEELEDRLTEEKDVSEKKMGDLEATVRMEVKEIASNFSNSNPSLRDLPIVIISAFKTGPIHSLQTVTFDSFLANYNNADRPGGGDGVLDLDSGVSLLATTPSPSLPMVLQGPAIPEHIFTCSRMVHSFLKVSGTLGVLTIAQLKWLSLAFW